MQDNRERHIGIFLSRSTKANRDRLSGVMRFTAGCPGVKTVYFNIDNFIPSAGATTRLDAKIGFANRRKSGYFKTPGKKIKVVLLENDLDNVPPSTPTISIDNHAVAKAAATLLLNRGYTNFAYVGSNIRTERPYSLMRGTQFASIIRRHGYDCSVYQFQKTTVPNSVDELQRLVSFVSKLRVPCGIMVYADNMAQLAIDACRTLRLSVPGQIALVGVDNETEICESLRPALTSILPDFEYSGFLAAQTAFELISGKDPVQTRQTYGVRMVVERESTQDLRGGGRIVSLAEEFMRKNFAARINVSDVASKLNVSRRLLEIRFREIQNRSIHDCLSEIRLNEAMRRLQTTSMSINDIMTACGYGSYKPFRLAFLSATGLTPLQWRKSHWATPYNPN